MLTTPFLFAFILADSGSAALLAYVPISFLSATWSAPTYACIQGLVSLRMRAMASAVLLFVLNLIGLGMGPWSVGLLSDYMEPTLGVESLRYAMLYLIPGASVWSAVHFLLAAKSLRADLEQAPD